METNSCRNMLGRGHRIPHHVDSPHRILDCIIHLLHDQGKQTRRLEIAACDDIAIIDQPCRDGMVQRSTLQLPARIRTPLSIDFQRSEKTQLFSLAYLPSNLYGYLFYGFDLQKTFPFLVADNPMHPIIFPNLTPSVLFEQTTGILWTSPFLLFALIPLVSLIKREKIIRTKQLASLGQHQLARFCIFIVLHHPIIFLPNHAFP